jgi:predicted nucleic acid-binding protein
LFVDTSVWSPAFRRDAPDRAKEVRELVRAIAISRARWSRSGRPAIRLIWINEMRAPGKE